MTNNKRKIIFAFTVVFLFSIFYFLFSISAEAAEPLKLQVQFPCSPIGNKTCPTPEQTASSPAAYIARFYQFALMISGALAFAMIIFGAIQYIVSAGNATQQNDARDRIFQALWGVALLLGAWLILHTIDPKMVSLTDPKLDLLKVQYTKTMPSVHGGEGTKCYYDQNTDTTYDCLSPFICKNEICVKPTEEETKKQEECANKGFAWRFAVFEDAGSPCEGAGYKTYPDSKCLCLGPKEGPHYYCCGPK